MKLKKKLLKYTINQSRFINYLNKYNKMNIFTNYWFVIYTVLDNNNNNKYYYYKYYLNESTTVNGH